MSIASEDKRECPKCGEVVGASALGQINPHHGRNRCDFSGLPSSYDGGDPDA